jgi:hypothetical protein
VCPATITRWLARAAKHARAFGEEHDRVDVPTELQLDEISARPASQPRSPWIVNALEPRKLCANPRRRGVPIRDAWSSSRLRRLDLVQRQRGRCAPSPHM